jgi:hypothetical protein
VVVVVVVVVVPAASYMYMREQAAWIVSIDTFSSFSFYRPLASRCRSPPSLSVHQRVQFSSCLLLGRLRPNLPSSSPDCDGRQERHRPAPARLSVARAPPPRRRRFFGPCRERTFGDWGTARSSADERAAYAEIGRGACQQRSRLKMER